MKGMVLLTVGAVCVLVGVVWFLQGVGVVGGSFMSGSSVWLVIGVIVAIAGCVLLAFGVRGRRKRA
jgi:hypothetical protein